MSASAGHGAQVEMAGTSVEKWKKAAEVEPPVSVNSKTRKKLFGQQADARYSELRERKHHSSG